MAEVFDMGFRAWLRGLLEDGVYQSQYDMAEKFGSKQPTVNHWLQGNRRPTLESCVMICEATGKPLAELAEMVRSDTRDKEEADLAPVV